VPLNLSNRDQNSGHLFYNRRLRAALTRFSVRMKHDDRKQQAALVMSVVLVALGCGWMALLHLVRPAATVGQSPIVGNRDTGALYAQVDGRIHPALNLTSARLVTGSNVAPSWISGSEIDKHPTGPMIGIPGVPDDLAVSPNPLSAWTICDTTSGHEPTVTAIAGELTTSGRAAPIQDSEAILGVHDNATYLIWNGHRTPVNLTDRAITVTLGVDPVTTRPVPISNALYDAMPATEPLVVPMIPGEARPSRWLPGTSVGRVLVTEDATGAPSGFYVLLPDGIQRVTAFVADLLRTAGRNIPPPQSVSPATVVGIPEVHVLDVDHYPTGRLRFVDIAANSVTCVGWTKLSTDRRATVTFLNGRGLPTPENLDAHIVTLVRDSRDPGSIEAQQVLVLPGAATLVASTSGAPAADTREVLYWVSPQGVRFGIEQDDSTLQALAVDPRQAVQAPWAILRTFASGPAISRTNALVARDTISPAGAVAAIPAPGGVR
jgi:type VII secretion protein EccB